VLTRERRAGGHGVCRDALEDDAAAVLAGAGNEVDDPVGVGHHRLVVLDDDGRPARVEEPVVEAEQLLDIGEVQTAGGLVKNMDLALLAHLAGQLEPLPLAPRQGGQRLAQGEVSEPNGLLTVHSTLGVDLLRRRLREPNGHPNG
jgi:hypothetical protein